MCDCDGDVVLPAVLHPGLPLLAVQSVARLYVEACKTVVIAENGRGGANKLKGAFREERRQDERREWERELEVGPGRLLRCLSFLTVVFFSCAGVFVMLSRSFVSIFKWVKWVTVPYSFNLVSH